MNTPETKTYLAIDLKSFYASVECQERGLDPLKANLVVADASRTDKTICLAVSPALKAYGIPGRARLFEVNQAVKQINQKRQRNAYCQTFTGSSMDADELAADPNLKLDFLAATPRMSLYIQYSSHIYNIYLRYIAPEDIHVYSIDEVFIDATHYLKLYHKTPHELAQTLILEVMKETGITATAGIGTNMFLAKCAMDIVAKHIPADQYGVRIAALDEYSFRKQLWTHRPLTDFWRIGPGIARRLENEGIYTMGDIARCSIGSFEDYYNEDLLYQMFGVNAELIIDHAWGYEPAGMKDIKSYSPNDHSKGIGQVLSRPYSYEEGEVIVKEMTDQLSLKLVDRNLVTDFFGLAVGYDAISLEEDEDYKGDVSIDFYGRAVPKGNHGAVHLDRKTASSELLRAAALKIYHAKINKKLFIRRINVVAINVTASTAMDNVSQSYRQPSLFEADKSESDLNFKYDLEKEKKVQQAILEIKKKYGKNAAVRGMDWEEGATTRERNQQIGGHKA